MKKLKVERRNQMAYFLMPCLVVGAGVVSGCNNQNKQQQIQSFSNMVNPFMNDSTDANGKLNQAQQVVSMDNGSVTVFVPEATVQVQILNDELNKLTNDRNKMDVNKYPQIVKDEAKVISDYQGAVNALQTAIQDSQNGAESTTIDMDGFKFYGDIMRYKDDTKQLATDSIKKLDSMQNNS